MPSFTVYYVRPTAFGDHIMGYEYLKVRGKLPSVKDLEKTHARLGVYEAADVDFLFVQMQGENWSPNGEARPLIQSLGLEHTSMSVGDIAVFNEPGIVENEDEDDNVHAPAGSVWFCDLMGWVYLGQMEGKNNG